MSDKIIRKAMALDGQQPGPHLQKFLEADKKADMAMEIVKKSIEDEQSGSKKN